MNSNRNREIVVLGSGPGGYVAAIRAAQLGFKVAIVEKESLGGICLNWGCIPTKALLKSAEVYNDIKNSSSYGFKVDKSTIQFDKVIKRSRNVADNMSKGVDFLMKKNNIEVIYGKASLKNNNTLYIEKNGHKDEIVFKKLIIAAGARSRQLPSLPIDGEKIIEYRKAMTLTKIPKKISIVGAGAIGCEFAYLYNSMGSKVTIIEYMDRILPHEDKDISKQLSIDFQKKGIEILTSTEVINTETKNKPQLILKTSDNKKSSLQSDVVLSAVGIKSNIENLGLEKLGIKTEYDKIIVNDYYQTNLNNIYAIGDIIPGPALAHVASAEGVICVEKISGLDPETIDYNNVPSCTYCQPEVASVGYTEENALKSGYILKIGKFPFTASGKANAIGKTSGFVKMIFDAKYGEILGAHIIGPHATDLIAEIVTARKLETTGYEILKSIHPHPTISEAIMEATADAYGECIHL